MTGEGGVRQDVTLKPELSGPKRTGVACEGYFTFAPTTVSHCFVIIPFA